MFNDHELEDLYAKLDELCQPQVRTVEPLKEVKQALSSSTLVTNTSSLKELEDLLNDLNMEENLGEMKKNDLFLKTETGNKAVSADNGSHNKFITKTVSPNGVFSNMKRNVRQSAKARIAGYANTSAKVVRESNMEPLKLEQYTEK